MLKELPSDSVCFTVPPAFGCAKRSNAAGPRYGPWDDTFIKRRDGPVADPSRKDTKIKDTEGQSVSNNAVLPSRVQRRFRPALCAPNSLGFPGKSASTGC